MLACASDLIVQLGSRLSKLDPPMPGLSKETKLTPALTAAGINSVASCPLEGQPWK
jgi:hypothetical protein